MRTPILITTIFYIIHQSLTKTIYDNLPNEQIVLEVAKGSKAKELDLSPMTNYFSLYQNKNAKLRVKIIFSLENFCWLKISNFL